MWRLKLSKMNRKIMKEFKSAGFGGNEELTFSPEVMSCGHIRDGVIFEHNDDGPWIMSFLDLETAYMMAKAQRESATRIMRLEVDDAEGL